MAPATLKGRFKMEVQDTRALSGNKEDLPEHFAIIQGSSCPKEKTCCKKDVAEPKKSTGFFGWLMGD